VGVTHNPEAEDPMVACCEFCRGIFNRVVSCRVGHVRVRTIEVVCLFVLGRRTTSRS
jgi:hypothetical protein